MTRFRRKEKGYCLDKNKKAYKEEANFEAKFRKREREKEDRKRY
jgi:hypothetical protein